ncbi:hypothetical protein [Microaceticoccus formicicus]|nr:hypothetical protein VZL98_10285 [Peptoniphilaceae bacterium AMB_02]
MEKLKIANLPTRIEKLEKISNELDTNLYVKRDDFTPEFITSLRK